MAGRNSAECQVTLLCSVCGGTGRPQLVLTENCVLSEIFMCGCGGYLVDIWFAGCRVGNDLWL